MRDFFISEIIPVVQILIFVYNLYMIQNTPETDSEINPEMVCIPRIPCETCGFWSVMCDQSKCEIFQKYKEEIRKINPCR